VDFGFTDEEEAFRTSVRAWAGDKYPMHRVIQLERLEDLDGSNFPHEVWDEMAEAGFFGVGIDQEWGGQGGSALTQCILAEELARRLVGLTWLWGVQSYNVQSIHLSGSAALKREFLPRLVKGEIKTALAVTEPGGGTDVLGAMKTVASPTEGGWTVNGAKIWSTLAHVADYLLLLARTSDAPGKPAAGKTLFLVPTDQSGVVARPIPKLGMRSVASCEVQLVDAFVPESHVIGEVDRGWYHLLATLNNERILIAAVCVGILRAVMEDAIDYALNRRAFGRAIAEFQVIQHWIADMHMSLQQAALLTHKAAWMYDQGMECGVEASTAKTVASEYASAAADRGIQILGGMGYSAEHSMQLYWRDLRVYQLAPITNEMARNIVAHSVGLPRSW